MDRLDELVAATAEVVEAARASGIAEVDETLAEMTQAMATLQVAVTAFEATIQAAQVHLLARMALSD